MRSGRQPLKSLSGSFGKYTIDYMQKQIPPLGDGLREITVVRFLSWFLKTKESSIIWGGSLCLKNNNKNPQRNNQATPKSHYKIFLQTFFSYILCSTANHCHKERQMAGKLSYAAKVYIGRSQVLITE